MSTDEDRVLHIRAARKGRTLTWVGVVLSKRLYFLPWRLWLACDLRVIRKLQWAGGTSQGSHCYQCACTIGWIQACIVLRLTWKCGPTVRYHQFTSIFQHVTKETTAACDVTWKCTRGTKGSRTLPIMIHGWINCLYLEAETVCSAVDVSEGNLPTLLNFLSLLRVPPCNKLS